MVTWLWIPLTAIASALAARWIFLEYKLRNYHSTEREFTKRVHQLFSSVLSDLRRPLSSLEHVRSIYGSADGGHSPEYTEIVDQCTGHTVQEFDKAKLFFDLASEQYKKQPTQLSLKDLLTDAWTIAKNRHPESQVRLELNITEDPLIGVSDRNLLKALFAQQLHRILLASPLKVKMSVQYPAAQRLQIVFESKGRPALKNRSNLETHGNKISNLLFGESDSSLDDRLSAALCLAMKASVIETSIPTGEHMEILFDLIDVDSPISETSTKLQA